MAGHWILNKDICMKKIIFYIILSNTVLSSILFAQNPTTPLTVAHLGNHRFMPNNYIKDPFIKTYIQNSLGLGKALDVNIPLVVIDGEPLVALRGDLIFLSLDFEYHHAVKDWLAVWGRVLVLGRLGNGTQALISQGITAVSGFDLGWLFKLHRTKNTQLSGSLSLSNSETTIVNLLDFINGIIEGDLSPNNQLVRKVPALRTNAGLRYAWAVNDFFATYFLTLISYGQSVVERNQGKFFYRLGGVLDFDLSTRTVLPFGVAIGAVYNSLPRTGDRTRTESRSIFLRIGYNSQPDFVIGVEVSIDFIPLSSTGETLKAGLTSINMRYYFR
jgi:hypothetical protein